MFPPNALEIPTTIAWNYFPSLEALKDCAARAAANARTKGEKAFTTRINEKVTAFGMRTFMSSSQAAKLSAIAVRAPAKRKDPDQVPCVHSADFRDCVTCILEDTAATSAEARPTPSLNGGW
jgi:hypothetical protein